jgi:peptidoglycan/LPS O-acetylase OafA/YrhL
VRATLLSHASVLVEMTGTTCLMDPIFFAPFEEGALGVDIFFTLSAFLLSELLLRERERFGNVRDSRRSPGTG